VSKKSPGAHRQLGDKRDKRRWARNGETAKYLNVSNMTLWRWKNQPGYNFPPSAKIDSMEFNDLDKVDTWMEAYIQAREGGDD
jgi:hypothetical protein